MDGWDGPRWETCKEHVDVTMFAWLDRDFVEDPTAFAASIGLGSINRPFRKLELPGNLFPLSR